MKENIVLTFTNEEIENIKNIVINYYGVDEEDFNINEYDNEEIKRALIEGSIYY